MTTKPDHKRAAKPTRENLEHMATQLIDMRVNSARINSTLAPALGVDPELDVREAEYRLAVEAFAREN